MITLLQMALSVGLNAIPVGGVVLRGWTPATALTLYWCENLVAALLIALRIAIHRRLTRRRGHYRLQINAKGNPGKGESQAQGTYLGEFLTISLAFTLVHGIFLAAVLAVVVKVGPHPAQLVQGLRWMVAVQVGSFVLDLFQVRKWPFADLKKNADRILGRVILIQLAIIGGMMFAAFSSRPEAFFAVFGFLKTLSDVASRIPYTPKPGVEAPRWFLWFANRFDKGKHWKTGQDAATWWRETRLAERRRVDEDELVIESPEGA
ncbi:hypothetical protein SAMN05444166_8198 [Singulisphaera sp. GP187]|uniref:DUF6498-containing protein n=1 Tax=Singulisphaera sp. GP187 TaxID=1882752 RepID=UPI00092B114E|nr:DUF6498-containing protein [Singulisphaera sp. GP187]SIO66729.1 hypothetical protein SAMN05444166_8198 [Singulisphaera sp. GP187]